MNETRRMIQMFAGCAMLYGLSATAFAQHYHSEEANDHHRTRLYIADLVYALAS